VCILHVSLRSASDMALSESKTYPIRRSSVRAFSLNLAERVLLRCVLINGRYGVGECVCAASLRMLA
jgi:hypothetical protein